MYETPENKIAEADLYDVAETSSQHTQTSTQTSYISSYIYRTYAKAALAFAGTVGTFLWAKTSGWIPGWLGENEEETGEEKKLSLKTDLVEETEPLITSFSPKKRSLQDTLQPLNPDAIPVGNELRISTCKTYSQSPFSVSGLSDGGFVVTWQSYSQDGSAWEIYAQRYGANSNLFENEFLVNNYTIITQPFPSVSGLSDGGFVVAWESYGQDGSDWDVCARRYGANGTALGNEFRVHNYIINSQAYPSVSGLSDGGFVVVWESYLQDGSGYGIYAQRYGANGNPIGNEFLVNNYTIDFQWKPSISDLSDGGFVVAWESDEQDGSYWGIYAQRYGANGTRLGNEFRVNNYTTNSQRYPLVSGLSDGGFVVAWASWLQDGSWDGMYAQRYGMNGTRLGNEFRVNNCTPSDQHSLPISSLSDGGFMVVWESWGQDGGIYAQRYGVNGAPLGNEFRVNNYTINPQGYPSVSSLSDGGFVVVWASYLQDDSYEIYAQRFSFPLFFNPPEFRVNTNTTNNQQSPSVSSLSDGGFVVVWEGAGSTDGSGVYAQRYGENGTRWGNEFRVNNSR